MNKKFKRNVDYVYNQSLSSILIKDIINITSKQFDLFYICLSYKTDDVNCSIFDDIKIKHKNFFGQKNFRRALMMDGAPFILTPPF